MDREKMKVLLIEDNPGDARLIQELLAEAPGALFNLEHVDTLTKGLARLAQGGVDVILLDLSLSDSQGLEGLDRILAQTLSVPIVVLSGLSDEAVALKAVQTGAQDYLVKGSMDGNLLSRSLRYAIERQRLRVALRESEARYRLLADNIADVIWTADAEARITYVSPSIKRLLGYTVEEAMKLQISDILTPDSLDQARKLVEGQVNMRAWGVKYPPTSMTLEHIRKDGSTVWAEVMLSFMQSRDGRIIGIMGATRDITERRKAEEALRQSEDYFRALTENASDGVVVLNGDGTVRYESPSFERMLGYKPGDRIGRNAFEFVHPDDIMYAAKSFEQLMQNPGSTTHAEVRAMHQDGSWHILEVTGKNLVNNSAVRGIVANFRDVTERRRAEEALRQSEQNYRILFESKMDGMIVIDETMEVMFANQTAAKLGGFDSAQDLVGLNVLGLVALEERERAFKLVKEEVFEKDLHRAHEYRAITKDGREVWLSAVSTRTEYQGRMAALVSVRDITELKKTEEEKKKLEEQIQLAGRLAAVGELAAGVAHELNNPLAAIKGFAQLLAGREGLNEGIKKDLQTIYMESQRASKITQNLLYFARRHEPEKRLISINEALERTLELGVHQLKVNNIELVMELAPDLPRTMADFHQMQEIFVNIITNAEQAMVEAHGKGRLIIGTKKVGGMAQITFTDDGPGISEENLKRLFDPFFTTKEVGKGTGLGLSICYGLVEAHGGRIYAKSKVGNGVTFVVEIPIVSEAQLLAASSLNPGTGM